MAKIYTMAAMLLVLTACGSSNGIDYKETTKSAAAGAAAGAGINYLLGNDPYQGAVVGAAGGAVAENVFDLR